MGCYNYIIAPTSSSSNTATVAAIGGAVGGAVLLVPLVTLCIILWCVVRRYNKGRKEIFSANQPRFTPAHNSNLRYLYKPKDVKDTERNSGMEAKMCKY